MEESDCLTVGGKGEPLFVAGSWFTETRNEERGLATRGTRFTEMKGINGMEES